MKDKTVALLLCLFLGGIGAHKFYLGQTAMGLLYLFFCWTFIPAFVAFIELIMLLVMDQNTFNMRFNMGAVALAGAQVNQAQNIVVNVPGGGGSDITTQLSKLNDLRVSGALTEAEFEQQKQKLLSS